MACFELAIQTVLQHEGEFVNDPQDPGGATKYGISLRWLKSRLAGSGVCVNAETIRQLTREQAMALYQRYFWVPYPYDRIRHQGIATKVFDFNVNAGSHAAHTALQWALKATGNRDVMIDGVLGEKTLKAVNTADPLVLLASYRSEMAGYYRLLQKPHFEAGWLKRAYT